MRRSWRLAVLLRENTQTEGIESSPSALLKALLLNSADKLLGVEIGAQGLGRINLSASADGDATGLQASLNYRTLVGNALKHDDIFELTLVPEAQGHPADMGFRVTLVYNDRLGAEVQNNLYLTVIDNINGANTVNGYTSEDNMKVQNSVEQVVLELASRNSMEIRVVAQKIFLDEYQNFVLS